MEALVHVPQSMHLRSFAEAGLFCIYFTHLDVPEPGSPFIELAAFLITKPSVSP